MSANKNSVGYLGPEGSFSEKAAREYGFSKGSLVPIAPAPRVVAKLLKDEVGRIVLPYKNSIEGEVRQHLDLIYQHNLKIVGQQEIPIEWYVAKYPGTKKEVNQTIYSHNMGLRQCSNFIETHYPDNLRVEVDSTSDAARKVREEKRGLALAGLEALVMNNNPLEIIATDIGNDGSKYNRTNFFVLAKEEDDNGYDPESKYSTLITVTPHFDKSGLLNDISGIFKPVGLNMTDFIVRRDIFNHMSGEGDRPFLFYIELSCHKSDRNFKNAVETMQIFLEREKKQPDLEYVRVIGSYKM